MEWLEFILLGLGSFGFLAGTLITQEPLMGLSPAMLGLFAVMGFVIGSIVGAAKRRTWAGAWLGLILGPLGWFIMRLQHSRAHE